MDSNQQRQYIADDRKSADGALGVHGCDKAHDNETTRTKQNTADMELLKIPKLVHLCITSSVCSTPTTAFL